MSETAPKDSVWGLPSANHSRITSAPRFDSPAPGPAEAASNCSSAESVLIVEDDLWARVAVSRILAKLGFAVSEAGTRAEAIAALDAEPQWILLDLMLPDGCGIGVIREVRARKLASNICIMTGCDSDLLIEAHAAGAQHTFVKPLNVERLIKVMTEPAT
jgi:DNA-binding response OmpR family regulator